MTDRPDPERSPRAWTARPGVQRACARCGEQFALPWTSAKYCSPACRAQVTAERWAERRSGTTHDGPSKVDISPPREGG